MKRIFSILTVWLFTLATAFAQDFTAKANPSQVSVGENFRVQYTVESDNPRGFKGPDFNSDAFMVIAGPYESHYSSYQYVNGKATSSSSVTFTYTLSAKKTGTYTIPGATVTVDGKKLTSNKVSVTIGGSNSQGGQHNGGNNRGGGSNVPVQNNGTITSHDLFITSTASKTHVHEQEAILLTYKIYSRVNLEQLNPKMPDLKGFHVQEIELPKTKSLTPENYNGTMYNTAIWAQYVLFPQQTGKMTIPAIDFEATVMQQVRNMDPLDAFFNTGSSYNEINKTIVAPAINIQVDELPTKPAGFSGGVGKFQLKSELVGKEPKSGEALTLKLTVSGTGNMKLIKTPEVNAPKDFEAYDPKVTDETQLTRNGIEGTKTFEYIFVPRNPGKYTIPSVPFIYFDLESNAYKTLQSDEYTLDIAKGKNTGSSKNTTSIDEDDNDIRFIKTGDVDLRTDDLDTYFGSTTNWLTYLIATVVFIVIAVLFRKNAIENANVAHMKTKKANKMARKRLQTAKKMLDANKKEAFYDEIMKALYGYISDKLTIPAGDLNKDNIREKLGNVLPNEDLINQLIQSLDECEFARFAPAQESGALDGFYEKVIAIIENIDNSIKK